MRLAPAKQLRVLLLTFTLPLIVLAAAAIAAVAWDVDIGDITRDPVAVLEGHPLVGFLSAMGVVLWWVAASICVFTFALSPSLRLEHPVRAFLLWSSLMTLLLAIDDQFLIHEELAPRHLGLRERDVMAGYVCLTAAYLIMNRAVIRRSEWTMLAIALALFGASVATDYVRVITEVGAVDEGLDWPLYVEDGLKLLGIVGWTAYLVRFSYFTVASRVSEPTSEP